MTARLAPGGGFVANTAVGRLLPDGGYQQLVSAGGGGDVTVSITGVSASASLGSIIPALSKGVSGALATAAAGNVSAILSKALAGVSGTAQAGNLRAALSVALVGLQSTTAAGTVTASIGGGNVTVALTGVAASVAAGSLVPALSLSISGGSATMAAGSVASARTITLTSATASAQAGNVAAVGGVVLLRQKGLRKTRYVPSAPPRTVQELARYVQQELERLTDGLESPFTHQLLEVLNVEPQRKPEGKALIAYADGANWDPGSGEGLYAYYSGAWHKL